MSWVVLAAASIAILAAYQHLTLVAELDSAGAALHAEASQRADQHDAHLTALSAVAQAGGARENGAFLDVANTIRQFYPRIDEIQLVPFDASQPIIGTAALEPELAATIRETAKASGRQTVLLAVSARPGHYLMVKRSPNNDAARDAVVLAIDAERLISSEAGFWQSDNAIRRLKMPDGRILYGPETMPSGALFARTLGSASQPLPFEAVRMTDWRDLLPVEGALASLLAAMLVLLAYIAVARQRARTRSAERRAALSHLDARLTHASRVNAMGEMASGMAHELTQPLTAILAQAQAGRRLLTRNELAPLSDSLEQTIAQARRASAILDRLRNWSRPTKAAAARVDLGAALANVMALLAAEAKQHGVEIVVQPDISASVVEADPIEMEQIMFNLVRNAIEALADAPEKRVTISLRSDKDRVVLDVADTGPGVPSDLVPKLFSPFTTTRPDGTGLGLALSQRLAERAGGEIAYVKQDRGALFRVTLPRSPEAAK